MTLSALPLQATHVVVGRAELCGGLCLSISQRERENRNIWLELAALFLLCIPCSTKHMKTTGWSSPHCLFLPPAVPVSVSPDWITTNPSLVCGSSTWLLKEANISHNPPQTTPHTHPSLHMHSPPRPITLTGFKKLQAQRLN